MADAKISALTGATALAGTEVLPIVQSATTKSVAAADLLRQSGQTVTTSNPVLNLAQTWNAGGVTFTGLVFNATDTASASASKLFDLQVAAASKFAVTKAGAGSLATSLFIGGTAPAGASGLSSLQSFGMNWAHLGGDNLTDATTKGARWGVLHYTNSQPPMIVFYGSATSSGNAVNIGGGTSSGNAATAINFYTASNNTTVTGTNRFQIDTLAFFPLTDNAYNLGYAANRFANIYGVISNNTGAVSAYSGTAIPAGGTKGAGFKVSSTADFGIFFGSGAPTLAAAQGSLYMRSDGSSTITRMYINTDGGTHWTAVTTVG